jgi:hypothetical protein
MNQPSDPTGERPLAAIVNTPLTSPLASVDLRDCSMADETPRRYDPLAKANVNSSR